MKKTGVRIQESGDEVSNWLLASDFGTIGTVRSATKRSKGPIELSPWQSARGEASL